MSIQEQLRDLSFDSEVPGFIKDEVAYKAADRIDALEAALREIYETAGDPTAFTGLGVRAKIRSVANRALLGGTES